MQYAERAAQAPGRFQGVAARGPGRPLAPLPGEVAPTAGGRLELDVSVEYAAGCQRSHAARLTVPVLPPFRVCARASHGSSTFCAALV